MQRSDGRAFSCPVGAARHLGSRHLGQAVLLLNRRSAAVPDHCDNNLTQSDHQGCHKGPLHSCKDQPRASFRGPTIAGSEGGEREEDAHKNGLGCRVFLVQNHLHVYCDTLANEERCNVNRMIHHSGSVTVRDPFYCCRRNRAPKNPQPRSTQVIPPLLSTSHVEQKPQTHDQCYNGT